MKLWPIGYNNITQRNTIAHKEILSKDLTPKAIATISKEIKAATGLNIDPEILTNDSFYRKFDGKREIVDCNILNDEHSVRYYNDKNIHLRTEVYKSYPCPEQLALTEVDEYSDKYSLFKYYDIFSGDISRVSFDLLSENNRNSQFLNFYIQNGEIIKIEKL